MSDSELLHQCAEDRYRASGPGGQHRNKTDSAVRLRHLPTQVIVTAVERRSRQENRRQALRRLRAALAYRCRQPIDRAEPLSLPEEWWTLSERGGDFWPTVALVLDVLDVHQGRFADTASALDVSTSRLTKFLRRSDDLWRAVAELRRRHRPG